MPRVQQWVPSPDDASYSPFWSKPSDSQVVAQQRITAWALRAFNRCQLQPQGRVDTVETERFLTDCSLLLTSLLNDAATLGRRECLLFYVPRWAYSAPPTYPLGPESLRSDYRIFLRDLANIGYSVSIRPEQLRWGRVLGEGSIAAVYVQPSGFSNTTSRTTP